jgi:hypothetical protein
LKIAGVFLLAFLVGVMVAALPVGQPTMTCVYLSIRPDSVLVAAFVPPCDMASRPAQDTIRSWRLFSRSRNCDVGHVLIDTNGAARINWQECGENGVLRRVVLPNPEAS